MKKLLLSSCKDCPHRIVTTTPRTGGGEDWFCNQVIEDREHVIAGNKIWFGNERSKYKLIKGYIEWEKEEPVEIPNWCPLEDDK